MVSPTIGAAAMTRRSEAAERHRNNSRRASRAPWRSTTGSCCSSAATSRPELASRRQDATAKVSWPALAAHLADPESAAPPALEHVTRYDLGTLDGVRRSFSMPTAWADGRIRYSAATAVAERQESYLVPDIFLEMVPGNLECQKSLTPADLQSTYDLGYPEAESHTACRDHPSHRYNRASKAPRPSCGVCVRV